MFKRIELHNHSIESDGQMSIEQLAEFALEHDFSAFALTDHNTFSGNDKMEKLIRMNILPIEFVHGMELTTYYRHILCWGIDEHIEWIDIDKSNPDRLFLRVRQKGALVGIAHPFAMGNPLANGCDWVMDIQDFINLDFIKVINNAHSSDNVTQWQLNGGRGLFLADTGSPQQAGLIYTGTVIFQASSLHIFISVIQKTISLFNYKMQLRHNRRL